MNQPVTPEKNASPLIGILALQGDFDAHAKMAAVAGCTRTRLVRAPSELAEVDALILPGGESTTIAKLLLRFELMEPLRNRLAAGMPAYGTCAGLILLAQNIDGRPDQPTIGALNVTVARNAFGRQVDSFETDIHCEFPDDGARDVRGVFIRAPYVTEVRDNARVLAVFNERIVAVQQGSILGTAFHPELTADTTVHGYFLEMVRRSSERR